MLYIYGQRNNETFHLLLKGWWADLVEQTLSYANARLSLVPAVTYFQRTSKCSITSTKPTTIYCSLSFFLNKFFLFWYYVLSLPSQSLSFFESPIIKYKFIFRICKLWCECECFNVLLGFSVGKFFIFSICWLNKCMQRIRNMSVYYSIRFVYFVHRLF